MSEPSCSVKGDSSWMFEREVLDSRRIVPTEFHLEITNNCMFNCVFCWPYSPHSTFNNRNDPQWRFHNFDFGIFCELVDDLSEMGTPILLLLGQGDPLVHPKIMEMLEYATSRISNVSILTAFYAVNSARLRRLFELQISWLCVSMHAGTPEVYVKIRPGQNRKTFFKIKENLCKLTEMKRHSGKKRPHIFLRMVVCEPNYQDVVAFAQFAVDVGAYGVDYASINIHDDIKMLAPKSEQWKVVRELLPEAKRILESHGVYHTIDEYLSTIGEKAHEGVFTQELFQYQPCYIGWWISRANVAGDIIPCCASDKRVIGNLTGQRFKEIWRSHAYHVFRNEMKSGEIYRKYRCHHCPHVTLNNAAHQAFSKVNDPFIRKLIYDESLPADLCHQNGFPQNSEQPWITHLKTDR